MYVCMQGWRSWEDRGGHRPPPPIIFMRGRQGRHHRGGGRGDNAPTQNHGRQAMYFAHPHNFVPSGGGAKGAAKEAFLSKQYPKKIPSFGQIFFLYFVQQLNQKCFFRCTVLTKDFQTFDRISFSLFSSIVNANGRDKMRGTRQRRHFIFH